MGAMVLVPMVKIRRGTVCKENNKFELIYVYRE